MSEALAIHEAYKQGDLEALRHSPLAFIRTLLDLGADPNYEDHAGFPLLIAALSTDRMDRCAIIELLLRPARICSSAGSTTGRRYTTRPQLRMWNGSSFFSRTAPMPTRAPRINDCATPLEEAEILGSSAAIRALC